MINFKEKVSDALSAVIEELSKEEIDNLVETPPSFDMGDYAFPVFRLAKTYKKAPNLIAEDIKGKLGDNEYFEKIENAGPYVNFFINKEKLLEAVYKEIEEKGEIYGSSDMGKGKNVIVEFSSPNIAKPMHIGHIRSTVIGNALYHIFKHLGYNTVAINHLGDYGTQFGMLIAAYKLWGDREAIEKNPIDELLDLYVRYNKLQELDPAARDTARDWFKKLEQGDEEATEIWTWMKKLSIVEFEKVYDMLGIKYDSYKGEAFYSDKMPAVIEEIKEKNIGKMDDGAYIVDLKPYNLTPLIIVKSNGTTTYATRDIAAARYRKKTYDFYKNIYVVASEQNLHFQQWKQVLKLMGDEWADDCIHVNFGLISLKDGALSTRQGRVLKLEDVLNKAIEKTRDIIEKRNPNLENKDEVAKMVGTGAIVFQELFNQRIKDYVFDWDKTLSFEGETGPYAQYTYARCKSLIDKNGGFDPSKVDFDLVKDEAYEILKYVYDLPRTIVMAMEKYEAFYITRNIIDIAKAFNKYYAANQIITDDEKLTNSRLAIVDITQKAIKVGMNLIGVQTPDRM